MAVEGKVITVLKAAAEQENYSGPQILDSRGGLYLLWSSPTEPALNPGSMDLAGCAVVE